MSCIPECHKYPKRFGSLAITNQTINCGTRGGKDNRSNSSVISIRCYGSAILHLLLASSYGPSQNLLKDINQYQIHKILM